MNPGGTCVNNPLGDARVIEMGDLLAQDEILQQSWTSGLALSEF
jgi:hypothetical protein